MSCKNINIPTVIGITFGLCSDILGYTSGNGFIIGFIISSFIKEVL